MEWTKQREQEARSLAELLTIEQWELLCKMGRAIPQPRPTEEEAAAAKKRQEERQEANARSVREYEEKRAAFESWKVKMLKGLKKPDAYDWSLEQITPLLEYAKHERATSSALYDAISFAYNWGFKRGMSCAKRQIKKAALHVETMKDGAEPSNAR